MNLIERYLQVIQVVWFKYILSFSIFKHFMLQQNFWSCFLWLSTVADVCSVGCFCKTCGLLFCKLPAHSYLRFKVVTAPSRVVLYCTTLYCTNLGSPSRPCRHAAFCCMCLKVREESGVIRPMFYLRTVTWAAVILRGSEASQHSSHRGDQTSY